MPTSDRTTIKATIDALVTALRANVVADPPTAGKPFRRVGVAEALATSWARPFLAIAPERTKLIGAIDNDKLIAVDLSLRIAVDATADDPHGAVLDMIGALDDYFDSIIDTGVIEGAEGFDLRDWTFEFPRTTAGSRVVSATSTQSFVVKVERSQNRIPAA